jgi:hypothetical protein
MVAAAVDALNQNLKNKPVLYMTVFKTSIKANIIANVL